MGLFFTYKTQFRRELLLQLRQPKMFVFSSLFFAMMVIFFPLTLVPDPAFLRQIAPGVFWVALLLAFLLTSERIFQDDYQDGVIEQWLVSGNAVSLLVFAKLMVHYLLNLVPLLVLSVFLGALFDLSWDERFWLALSFILGAPAILFLCALAAAFSTNLQQKGVLMALILFPLVIPVMIFGSMTLTAAMQTLPTFAYLALLLAFSLLAVFFLPFAIAAIIRISLTD